MRIFAGLFLLICLFVPMLLFADPLADPIVVIVNLNNPQSDLSFDRLDKIFKKKATTWSYEVSIIPLNQEFGTKIREEFSRLVHFKTAKEMKEYWLQERYKGVTPPQELPSAKEVKRIVASKVAAIGYIYLSEVDKTVKVLTIDGLSTKDPKYKLK